MTALQIRADQNTSVFGVNVQVADQPPPDPRIAADSFGRTVTNGWGTADVGGTWAVSDTASSYRGRERRCHDDDGQGPVAQRAARRRRGRRDDHWHGPLQPLPSGGNAFAYLEVRRVGTDGYRGQIRVGSNGAVFVQIRKAVNGSGDRGRPRGLNGTQHPDRTTLGLPLHRERQPSAAAGLGCVRRREPTTWQTELDDTSIAAPGAVGVRGYLGSPVSNGPLTLTFDDFLAKKP